MKEKEVKLGCFLSKSTSHVQYLDFGWQSVTLLLFFLIRDGQRSGPIFRYWQKNKRYSHVKFLSFFHQLKGMENQSMRVIVYIALQSESAERKLSHCVWMLLFLYDALCVCIDLIIPSLMHCNSLTNGKRVFLRKALFFPLNY